MFILLFPYIALALNLFLVLGLFLGLNKNLCRLRNRVVKFESQSVQLCGAIQNITGKVSEWEENPTVQPSSLSTTLGDGMNTTLRTKVLKMSRLGQSSDRIAGALRVPKGEVDLLLKVHRIVMRPYEDERDPVREDVSA